MARGTTEIKVIDGEPARFTDTANALDRFVANAKSSCELPDGSKGEGQSLKNDQQEAEQEALFNAYAARAKSGEK